MTKEPDHNADKFQYFSGRNKKMSEEKLYAVKNAKGRYLSFSDDKHYRWREGQIAATTSPRIAHDLCTEHGGHVVTLIEEPEKVVLTKKQAEIVKNARDEEYPAAYIFCHTDDFNEKILLFNAYLNGLDEQDCEKEEVTDDGIR